jgi:uncharacterized protein YyaL (SSP411 family)
VADPQTPAAPPENRLGAETSPYLRQHRNDPVDWYTWGEDAFARARELDRPLFVSIGYSACHWCHVMGHESFADPTTAEEMNDLVVAVKVDREERPDVDAVYMEAVQAASGHGGWPMSVFALPDGRPFFAGTYFPNRPGRGVPEFRAVLAAVADAWATRREAVVEQAEALSEAIAARLAPPPPLVNPGGAAARSDGSTIDAAGAPAVMAAIEAAAARLSETFDPVDGGFGRAPKFPQPLLLDLLLQAHAEGLGRHLDPSPLEVVESTLEAMAGGGIWDHLGGGFSRYSVDREWLVPHFEKMLYDEALLARVYLHAWQLTGDARWRQVLAETVTYVLRDLRLPGGGLASAEDADSEGEEGRYYLWEAAELNEVLGPELGGAAARWWGVRTGGNFEGRNILHRPERGDLLRPPEIEEARARLSEARARRVRPDLDDKVLTEWNAMMCATLAEAALATGEHEWRLAAEEIGSLLATRLCRSDGRVLRSLPPPEDSSRSAVLGYSSDVAWMIEAYVRLAECTGDTAWLARADLLAGQLSELFEDRETGGLFTTGADAEELVVRPRELYDNVIPSASSVAAGALLRLGALLGRDEHEAMADRLLAAGSTLYMRAPTAVPALLGAAALRALGAVEVAVTGDRPDLVEEAGRLFIPRRVLAWVAPAASEPLPLPLLQGREEGYAYVCRFGECRLPSPTVDDLRRELSPMHP